MSHSTQSKQLRVNKTDETSVDKDFQEMRDNFDIKMKKMEEEMCKFRSRMLDRQRDSDIRSLSPMSRSREMSSFIETVESPLIKECSDGKTLELKFDVTDYEPEEVVVKTVDNKLLVHAKHEEKSDSRSVFREYNREFLLPEGTNPEHIKSSLSRDGVLTVEAPLPKADHRRVAIEKH